jgi:threonine dehydrogenase-like Zn-dependent dehydrogenase
VKAALLVRPGVLVVQDIEAPIAGPDDVLVAVGGVGLCGSDVSMFRGTWTAPHYPWIMGHEAFGTIEAVGERVPPSRVGERVVLEPNIACLDCEPCREGRTSTCLRRQSMGMNRPGALAEKVVLPSRFAWPVGAAPAADLVCIEPLTVVEAALRRLAAPLPSEALVVGVGAQGLLMCLALLRRGVEVHAFDINADRMELARALGARTGAAGEPGERFDLVIDTAGTPASMATSLGRVAPWGALLVLGLDSRHFEISAADLVRRQLVLQGSLTYDYPGDFAATIDLVQGGHISPGRIALNRYPMASAQEAFEAGASSPGKTWISVDPTAG